jgi:hypothetical protein
MGRPHNTNRRDDKSMKKSGRIIRRKETFAELSVGNESIVEMILNELVEDVDWIQLAQHNI